MASWHMTCPRQLNSEAVGFVHEFAAITGLQVSFDDGYAAALERLAAHLRKRLIRPFADRRRHFLAHVNRKFRLNGDRLAAFYTSAAEHGFTFNYHQKRLLQDAFNLADQALFDSVLDKRGVYSSVATLLRKKFEPVGASVTVSHLRSECADPSKLRREKGERNIGREIIKAQFSAFMWCSLTECEMHAYFDPYFSECNYRTSFWEQLQVHSPHLFNRSHALEVVRIDQGAIDGMKSYTAIRNFVSSILENAYLEINNHGFLAVLLDPLQLSGRDLRWEIVADITLFAEKHRQVELNKGYFRPDRVRQETVRHIPTIDEDAARFDLVNEGFTYRDCFVLTDENGSVNRLLLIFQKNARDETTIACPTCRSADVQGNSYSSIGVRSWECNNLLCPDRSKYNRGKRYSFRSLAMQRAIDDDLNMIPVESVRRWSRDVVAVDKGNEIFDMLLRHYSMHGDTIHVRNWGRAAGEVVLGRTVVSKGIGENPHESAASFWSGPFFARYVCMPAEPSHTVARNLGTPEFQVLNGDAAVALRNIGSDIFDGAVTSPPYYNAREYAQWPNIYCYLHDMFRINREVFRTLKPGATYLYNIFDYFDNENTIVFSDMGRKRMILSAYTVDLFRRIGFECVGNVVWDKGDIEGKRGFNAGNFSPYYQAPFNCWEHVLVFRKPGGIVQNIDVAADRVLRAQPVVKMIRGKNLHGHTAPFPDAIPEILTGLLWKGATVLDPFGGSLTTGRVASRLGMASVCVERSEEFCLLGLKMKTKEVRGEQLGFFGAPASL